jgi:hypothetical protein
MYFMVARGRAASLDPRDLHRKLIEAWRRTAESRLRTREAFGSHKWLEVLEGQLSALDGFSKTLVSSGFVEMEDFEAYKAHYEKWVEGTLAA